MDEPQESSPSPPQQSAEDSLVGDSAGRGNSSDSGSLLDVVQGGGEPLGLDASIIPSLRQWFVSCVVTDQGVLFENDMLSIGLRHEYRGPQGRITLFFKNPTSNEMTDVSVEVPVPEGNTMRMQTQDPPSVIGAGAQERMQLMVEALAPFSDAPQFTVSFSVAGQRYSYPLRLPAVASCFMDPVVLEQPDFVSRWRALDGQNREQQELINPATPIDEARMSQIKEIITSATGMRMGLATGVDQTAFTISTAGTFRTGATNPNGDKISVGCLMRLEANPKANAFRVTVRAVHGRVSLALKNIIKAQLVG
jgi:AP-2 complex subunit alpha